jgi:ribonuclease R
LPLSGPQARLRDAVERQVLLTNQRSVYSAEPGLHYALGVTPYSRFSSPMREVVGVFTHKEALEQFKLVGVQGQPEVDAELRELVIQAANRSKQRQGRINKDVLKLAVDGLFGRDLKRKQADRPTRPGTIMGLSASRLYVRLDDPPVDLKVYLDDLQARLGTDLVLKDGEVEVAGPGEGGVRFAIGDRIALKVAAYEKRQRRWHLVPA